MNVTFDIEKIRRYDQSGPRYTSYPTAAAFHPGFGESDYRQHAESRAQNPGAGQLSLYIHIPFCDTVCFYCACNKIATKDRSKADDYLTLLYREMDLQSALFGREHTVEQLHWGGGTPTFLDHQQIRALMGNTRRCFSLRDDDRGDYSIEIDPRSVDAETIALLREIGFNRFSLGVQDVDSRVQEAVNRIQPIEKTRAIINACRENAAHSVSVDLIYGLPRQSLEGFARTLDTVIEMSPDRLSVFNYAHLPHVFKPQRRINADELPDAGEKLAILQHTIRRLTDTGYVYIGMDHFAKPDDELAIAQTDGSLHRNFQGYTTHAECDLIAMGVSAISSVNRCYSQNAKDIDSYRTAIHAGQLPVVRGVSLDEDDVRRRAVIQQLSCHFVLNFAAFEKTFGIDFNACFPTEIAELNALAEDGLLTLDNKQIPVSDRGRLLIRTICMVFDQYLRAQNGQQQFSKVI